MMTPKQKRFVDEYLIDLNATGAAILAGYSKRTARSIGDENLTKPDIKKAVDAALAERSKRAGIDADKVLAELASIAFAPIDAAKVKPSDKLGALFALLKYLRIANGPIDESFKELDEMLRR